MEYNNPSEIVKDLSFGKNARNKIMHGVDKLASAVKSTLGASGKCVIYEDAMGRPVITKDGVTVAESVVLLDPVENIGATLIKEAAKNKSFQARMKWEQQATIFFPGLSGGTREIRTCFPKLIVGMTATKTLPSFC